MFPQAFNNSSTTRSYSSYYNIYSNGLNLIAQLNETPQFEKILSSEDKKLSQLNCKEEIIRWLANTLLIETENDTYFMYESDTL